MMNVRSASRGQALVETAFMLPLVILSLGFLFWAGKEAVISERLENTERYAQQVLNSVNVYNQYSLLSLYDMASTGGANTNSLSQMCTAVPINNMLNGTFSVGDPAGGQTVKGANIWLDQTVSNPNCSVGGVYVAGLSRPSLLQYSYQSITIQTRAPLGGNILFNSGGSQTGGSQGYTPQHTGELMVDFNTPTMAMMYTCINALQTAVHQSLIDASHGTQDPTNPGTYTTADISAPPPTGPPSISTGQSLCGS